MTVERAKKIYMPMTETMYYILLSLIEPQHGYGIMRHVERITNGRIRLGAGTVYNSLSKLQADDLIELIAESDRRKIYLITEAGQGLIEAELKRLEELSANGRQAM
ncbi:MAG: PadR family transcriptional regulator [Oscillospiraceae bacterium]|jgi:DNA-binding PadR family transcriptional regulator|nr:PadR family transcriptional regulator [Oscillospiraceae bacterium]